MGAKRATSAVTSPSKRARGDSINARVKRVVEALMDKELHSDVPQPAREMLALGASTALASCVEDRHKMQSDVCDHIKDVLNDILSHLQAASDSCKATAAELQATLEASQAAAEAAQASLSEAEAATAEQQAKLAERRQAVKAEEKNVESAKSSQLAVVKARAHAEKERARRAKVEEGLQRLIAAEGIEPKEAKKECHRLVGVLERLGAESALTAAMPEVLTKAPEERKGFDEMVVESLTSFAKELLEAVDAELAENSAELAEVEAELVGNEAVKEKAMGEVETELESLTALGATQSEREAAKEAADSKAEEAKAAREEKQEELDQAEAELAEFAEVLQTFTGLVERSSAPPPVPAEPAKEVEAPEPAAAAPAE